MPGYVGRFRRALPGVGTVVLTLRVGDYLTRSVRTTKHVAGVDWHFRCL